MAESVEGHTSSCTTQKRYFVDIENTWFDIIPKDVLKIILKQIPKYILEYQCFITYPTYGNVYGDFSWEDFASLDMGIGKHIYCTCDGCIIKDIKHSEESDQCMTITSEFALKKIRIIPFEGFDVPSIRTLSLCDTCYESKLQSLCRWCKIKENTNSTSLKKVIGKHPHFQPVVDSTKYQWNRVLYNK